MTKKVIITQDHSGIYGNRINGKLASDMELFLNSALDLIETLNLALGLSTSLSQALPFCDEPCSLALPPGSLAIPVPEAKIKK